MYFLIIFGPPAVGKMSVGKEIQQATGIRLFHNHMAIEPVLNFFPFGSPPFSRLVNNFRTNLLQEVADSDLPGVSFTFVWDLEDEHDSDFLLKICEPFIEKNAEIVCVELTASVEQRLIRNKTPARLLEKPSKRDTVRSEANLLHLDKNHRMNSDGGIPLGFRHLLVDNTNLSAKEAADYIVETLNLPRVSAVKGEG
ncbi:MAG: AAA family ATPase [Pseudomonadota bacterium]